VFYVGILHFLKLIVAEWNHYSQVYNTILDSLAIGVQVHS
jgi:hypothetical protein